MGALVYDREVEGGRIEVDEYEGRVRVETFSSYDNERADFRLTAKEASELAYALLLIVERIDK